MKTRGVHSDGDSARKHASTSCDKGIVGGLVHIGIIFIDC
jgi:hypothetical protein